MDIRAVVYRLTDLCECGTGETEICDEDLDAIRSVLAEITRLRGRDGRFVKVLNHFGMEFQEDTIADLMQIVRAHNKVADAAGGVE